MKKIIFPLLMLCLSMSAFSQARKNRSEKISDTTIRQVKDAMRSRDKDNRLAELNLSREQKKQIREMRQQDASSKSAIEQDASLTDEQKKAKLKDIRKARQEKLRSILTAEQKEKLKAMGQE